MADEEELAERLHAVAIHLLRRLRRLDDVTALSAPRLSILSVLVFGGPCSLGALARAEQVKAPTMTRLVQALEADGLVERSRDPDDARSSHVRATARGRRILLRARERRVRALARTLADLSTAERERLARALPLLERVSQHPVSPDEP
jgi:DNA-binding MarR family transcriptional regulator